MDVFHESCTLSNPFRESTCYKHPPDPSCTDLLKVRHCKDCSNYDYNIFFAIIYLMNNQNQILKLQAFINLSLFA